MKKENYKCKRILSALIVIILTINMLPISAFVLAENPEEFISEALDFESTQHPDFDIQGTLDSPYEELQEEGASEPPTPPLVEEDGENAPESQDFEPEGIEDPEPETPSPDPEILEDPESETPSSESEALEDPELEGLGSEIQIPELEVLGAPELALKDISPLAEEDEQSSRITLDKNIVPVGGSITATVEELPLLQSISKARWVILGEENNIIDSIEFSRPSQRSFTLEVPEGYKGYFEIDLVFLGIFSAGSEKSGEFRIYKELELSVSLFESEIFMDESLEASIVFSGGLDSEILEAYWELYDKDGVSIEKQNISIDEIPGNVTFTPNRGVSGRIYVSAKDAAGQEVDAEQAFVIKYPALPDIPLEINNVDKVYDGQYHSIEVIDLSLLDNNLLEYSTNGEDWSEDNPVYCDVGEYTVYIRVSNPNYQGIKEATGTVKITKAEVTIKVDDASKEYGAAEPDFTSQVEGLVEGDSLDIIYTRAPGKDVGTYAISATINNGNYSALVTPGTLTILAKKVTIVVDDSSKTYGVLDPAFTSQVTGLIEDDDLDISYVRTNDDEDVGTYEGVLDANYTSNDNYVVVVIKGDFTIHKAKAEKLLVISSITHVYDGEVHSATAIGDTVLEDDTLHYSEDDGETWSETNPSFINAGVYEVLVKATNPNYEDRMAEATVTILPRKVTIVVDNASKEYGSADPVFTSQVTGLIEDDELNIIYDREPGDNVDTYAISATIDNDNYDLLMTPGTLTILAKEVTTEVDDTPKKDEDKSTPKYEPSDLSIRQYLALDHVFNVGKKHNIVVFMLDHLDEKYVDKVLNKNPDFADILTGFTHFTNNISTYGQGFPTTINMLTDKASLFNRFKEEYIREAWKFSNLISTLKKHGYIVNLHIEEGYDYLDIKNLEDYANNISKVDELTAYNSIQKILDKEELLKRLENKGLALIPNANIFNYIRLKTSDIGYIGENIEILDESAYISYIEESFYMIFEYMEQLKVLDLYDNTTIIITGNNGQIENNTNHLNMPVITALFVKPSNAPIEPLKDSSVPVHQENFQATLIQAAGLDYTIFGKTYFDINPDDKNEREFYQLLDYEDDKIQLVKYKVAGDAKDFNNWHLLSEVEDS